MSNFTVYRLVEITNERMNTIRFFQNQHLLCPAKRCQLCFHDMNIRSDRSVALIGYRWRCCNRARVGGCNSKISLLAGSMFTDAKVSLESILWLLFYWASSTPVKITKQHLALDEHTLCDYFQDFRNICSWHLLQRPILLGGVGITVEIDESLFLKAKYHRGHALYRPQRWVFGIWSPNEHLGYVVFVDRRDAATLLPIIEQHIRPGSVIHSDQWQAYNDISTLYRKPQKLFC